MRNSRNPLIENLITRTCCRQFTKKRVTRQIIYQVLKAGQAAPSAKNRQPWFFLVIRNRNCLAQIAKAALIGRQRQFADLQNKRFRRINEGKTTSSSNDRSIAGADFAILVFRNSDSNYQESNQEKLDLKEEQSVAAACTNMLNASQFFGIGMGWNCSVIYIENELREILPNWGFGVAKNFSPRAILPGGYPKGKSKKPIRKTLDETVFEIA